MRNEMFFDTVRNRFRSGLLDIDRKRGWYYALGAFLIVLGVIAFGMAIATTVFSVMAIGWILLIAGVVLAVHSFFTGKWSGFLLSLAAGALSAIAGLTILSHPFSGAIAITLVIGAILIAEGVYRVLASIAMQFPNWGWSVLSGVVAIVVGSLLLSNWQSASLWFIGAYVGIDLIFHGFAWIMFASRVHTLARAADTGESERLAA